MRFRRIAMGALITAALVLAAPLAADAHVRVSPDTAVAGSGPVQLTFPVPTEAVGPATTALRRVTGRPV